MQVQQAPPRGMVSHPPGRCKECRVADAGWGYFLCGRRLVRLVSDPARHMLRQPPGWAVDAAVWERVRAEVSEVLVVATDGSGAAWRVAAPTFEEHSFDLDRGHGLQRALPLRWWSSGAEEAPQPSPQLALPLGVSS